MEEGSTEDQGSGDPLERMAAHRHARALMKLSWPDAEAAQQNPIMTEVVAQFYESVGSIAANIAEGYSKSSGPDRARSFEYALGSARETVEWYYAMMPVLGEKVVKTRLEILGHILRLLIAIIPPERARRIRPKKKKARKRRAKNE
jgi:four helix bundle protein